MCAGHLHWVRVCVAPSKNKRAGPWRQTSMGQGALCRLEIKESLTRFLRSVSLEHERRGERALVWRREDSRER
jgi:hypothetical protein